MTGIVKKHWPLIAATGIFWATLAVLLFFSVGGNDGHLVYTLDDPYIHMAMAKNFAQHGVWGVGKEGFTSSSSSPLWTLLLSLTYILFGINELSPFILNLVFGTLLLVAAHLLLGRHGARPAVIFTVLLSIIFFTPLPSLVFSGQEHTLHTLIAMLFVYFSAENLSSEQAFPRGGRLLYALAPLVTAVRYEGLFLIAVVCALFVLRRRLKESLLVGGAGILPVLGYGLISIWKGWYFLPNSVLLKGNMPDLSSFHGILNALGYSAYRQMASNFVILSLILAALIVFFLKYDRQKGSRDEATVMISIFAGTALLHMQFAAGTLPGIFHMYFDRYIAYLVALGIFVIALAIDRYSPDRSPLKTDIRMLPKLVALALIILIVMPPFARRAVMALAKTPQASTNIFEQQYQMGLFLREFYPGKAVAARDIGAINYLADIDCLDIWGLTSMEVARAKRGEYYSPHTVHEIAKAMDVKIGIVYDEWFIPPSWINVGEWTISNNVACGDDRVVFYAVDPLEMDRLADNLRAFSSRLPKGVAQSGRYTN